MATWSQSSARTGACGALCGVGSQGGSVPAVCAHPDPYRVVLKNTGASVRNTGTRGDFYQLSYPTQGVKPYCTRGLRNHVGRTLVLLIHAVLSTQTRTESITALPAHRRLHPMRAAATVYTLNIRSAARGHPRHASCPPPLRITKSHDTLCC